MADSGTRDPKQDTARIKELTREIHWVEKVTMWSQIVLGLIGIAALIIYSRQLAAMNRQLNVMQQQLDTTDRPWMKITSVEPFPDSPNGFTGVQFSQELKAGLPTAAFTMVKVKAKNIGKSVALDVSIHGVMTLSDNYDKLRQEEFMVCSGQTPASSPPLSKNVFPDDEEGYSAYVVGSVDLSAKKTKVINVGRQKFISPHIVGCITYGLPSSVKFLHHTGFIYQIEQKRHERLFGDVYNDRPAGLFALGTNVKADQLILTGDSAVDIQ